MLLLLGNSIEFSNQYQQLSADPILRKKLLNY